jgi:DNA/RNA endonuclease YhcR with UshA esterase domain
MHNLKITYLLLICLFTSHISHAQKQISLADASKNIGDSVSVCGKVYTTRYFESSQDAPTLLNVGAAYPNQILTVVIYGEARKLFKEAPEVFFKDKNICVTGKVSLYKDKPQIIIYRPDQLIESITKN